MNRSCGGCLDAESPIRISFKKLHQWPESEAEFLKLIANKENSKPCHERYSSRQKYLRSYTFSRKQTLAEKTRRWFLKTKNIKETKERKMGCGVIKESFCSGFGAVFNNLFACIATVDVE
ncbi:uncharacterized protein LOC131228930 [Magnolia sinica]|uniref:uncharacterized protein LOC131228930 n=1 Tax=Magnolia sinica TaxID=86752 RepID=UPI00265B1C1C|nr:uncharacterized protein LOC131228930 [Magnolia sinica]